MRTIYLLLLCCIILFRVTGQPGSLDSSFGNSGIQTTDFFPNVNPLDEEGRVVLTSANGDIFIISSTSDDYPNTRIVKYLPDGRLDSSYGSGGYSDAANLWCTSAVMQGDKIIVAGFYFEDTDFPYDIALASYTADGKLDSSFGVNGQVRTDFGYNDYARSIVLQGDKLLVAGFTNNPVNFSGEFAVLRYTTNGVLDSSFGENGRVITDFNNSNDDAHSITLQGNKIIMAGTSNGDFALARYTANGKLDSSFGVNGLVTTDFDSSYDIGNSIVLQGNKIVVSGYTGASLYGNLDFALARYTADGALDSTFGVNGKVITDFNNSYYISGSIALQGDKIIVSGTGLARYTADGTLDSSFGVNGIVIISSFGANSIALQGDKIIAGGTAFNAVTNNTDFALARYTADGTLDSSFGEQGLLTGYFPQTITGFASTIIQGDKVIAAGYALNYNNNYDFVIARYKVNGILDSSFGVNGKVTTDFKNSNDEANSIALQGDKIILGGYTGDAPNKDIALARYTADGKLDSTFGKNGKVTTDFDYNDDASSMVLQGDKIIVAGYTGGHPPRNYVIARYTADGKLDSTFGKNGKVYTDFRAALALQGDKIIAAGYTYNSKTGNTDFVLARYTADGKLDTSFGKQGRATTDFNNSGDYATSTALQGDKIIAAGYTTVGFQTDIALARYTADGKLDTSFGVNGKVITDIDSSYDGANSIALQGDKIIVEGYSVNYPDRAFALVRYTADGALDSSFGMNGKVISKVGSTGLQAIAVHQDRLYVVGGNAIAAYQVEAPEPTVPAITIADVTVSESKRFAILIARLSSPTNKIVRVHFTTRDKTAVHNQDYIGISGPLFFIPGVNTTFKLPIPIIDDYQQEGDEQFEVVLSNAHNATIQDSVAVVTIVDDDNAPIAKQNASAIKITVNPNPSTDAFTVQLPGTNLKQPASVWVYDINGRLIEQRNNISTGQSLRLGYQYKAGTYIIEVVQGSQKAQTTIIKTTK